MKNIKYLDNFGTVDYYFSEDLGNVTIPAITKNIMGKIDYNNAVYEKYHIMDGEKPDMVSTKLYDSPEYYWTLFMFNDSLKDGLQGWPLSQAEFERMILRDYNPFAFLSNTIDYALPDKQGLVEFLHLSPEYIPDIKIYTFDGTYILSEGKIIESSSKLDGIIIEKNDLTSDKLNLGNGNDFDTHQIYLTGGTEWEEIVEMNGVTPIIAQGLKLYPLDYYIAFSEINLDEAIYQYYNEVDSTFQSLTHFDVKFDLLLENIVTMPESLRIIDYETVLNDRKKDIIVPDKNILGDLSRNFNSLLNQ